MRQKIDSLNGSTRSWDTPVLTSIIWHTNMVDSKNDPKTIIKRYYEVRVECMLPATLTYRVLAESPEEAASLIKSKQPNSVQHKLLGRREAKLTVYDSGSSII